MVVLRLYQDFTLQEIAQTLQIPLDVIAKIQHIQAVPLLSLTPPSEVLLGGLGVALLAVALLRLRADLPHLLPTV